MKACTVAGRGKKSLLCDPGSELRVGRRERRRWAKIMNGMRKKINIYILAKAPTNQIPKHRFFYEDLPVDSRDEKKRMTTNKYTPTTRYMFF